MSTASDPARDSVPVTPHATDPLPNGECRAVRVGGAGTVVGRTPLSGATYRTCNFLAGETRAIRFTHIKDTSTATSIEALY